MKSLETIVKNSNASKKTEASYTMQICAYEKGVLSAQIETLAETFKPSVLKRGLLDLMAGENGDTLVLTADGEIGFLEDYEERALKDAREKRKKELAAKQEVDKKLAEEAAAKKA